MILHTAPFGGEASPSYHWHVEIVPHPDCGAAGLRWARLHINPMPQGGGALLREA
jgi:hypothetical protein